MTDLSDRQNRKRFLVSGIITVKHKYFTQNNHIFLYINFLLEKSYYNYKCIYIKQQRLLFSVEVYIAQIVT